MFFFFFISAYAITLTRENAQTIFHENNPKPAFVFLVSDYCPHCKKIKPIIKHLEEKYSHDTSLTIAKIECDYEKVLCNKFPDSSTPNFYWVNRDLENAEKYSGAQDLSEITVFIEKKLSPKFIYIHSKEEFIIESEKRNESSIFLFNGFAQNQMDIINQMQNDLQNYPCYFFNILYETSSPFLCNYYFPSNQSICLNKQFKEKSIKKFIMKHAYPKIGPLSVQLVNHLKKTKSYILIFASEYQQFDDKFLEFSRNIPEHLILTYLNCENNYRLCFNLLIQPDHDSILIFNPSKKLIWRFHDEFDKDSLLTWISNVFSNRIRATGPGAGFFGYLGHLVDLSLENGMISFMLLVSILSVFAFMFAVGTAHTIHRNNRMKKKK